MARPVIVCLVISLCTVLFLFAPVNAATYRQYDPNLTEEMNRSGLFEPLSKEQYEREMSALNASMNETLGCDDFPRCAPVTVPVPLSPLITLSALGVTMLIGYRMKRG